MKMKSLMVDLEEAVEVEVRERQNVYSEVKLKAHPRKTYEEAEAGEEGRQKEQLKQRVEVGQGVEVEENPMEWKFGMQLEGEEEEEAAGQFLDRSGFRRKEKLRLQDWK